MVYRDLRRTQLCWTDEDFDVSGSWSLLWHQSCIKEARIISNLLIFYASTHSCRLNNQSKQMPQLEPKTDDLCRSKYIDVLLLFKFRLVDEKDRTFWPIGVFTPVHITTYGTKMIRALYVWQHEVLAQSFFLYFPSLSKTELGCNAGKTKKARADSVPLFQFSNFLEFDLHIFEGSVMQLDLILFHTLTWKEI